MNKEEEQLLIEICKKYDLNPDYLITLINIEKHYANMNKSRRMGIFKDMKSKIDAWTEE